MAEIKASGYLQKAKKYLKGKKNRKKARKYLKQILAKYPRSAAAAEAKELLEAGK
jgi:TolA-binding protein